MTVPKVSALPPQDRVFAPALAQSDIRRRRYSRSLTGWWSCWQLAIGAKRGCGAIVDFLVGEPARGLQKPAVTELMIMIQHDIVAINPIMIIRGWRKVGVLVILLNRQPPRVARPIRRSRGKRAPRVARESGRYPI